MDNTNKDNVLELIEDPLFDKGFNVRGLSVIKDGATVKDVFNYGNPKLKPFWMIAQWDSVYDFADSNITDFFDLGNGVYKYENPSKTLTVDTKQGIISFKELASECFDRPRKEGEGWPHLLIESTFVKPNNLEEINLSTMKKVNVRFKTRLTYFEDLMGEEANVGLHAAQFLLYLYMDNITPNSKGYGDRIWFGIPIFDNRNEFPPEYAAEDTGKEDASHQFIYSIDAKEFMKESLWKHGEPFADENNKWMEIDIDVLPYMKAAYKTAKERGFLANTEFKEISLTGMNMGWELPGTYDVEMQVSDFRIDVIK